MNLNALEQNKMNIVICGGGNMGHAIAGELSLRNKVKISLLTRSPEIWCNTIRIENPSGDIYISKPINVTSDPKQVIPKADIIIITVPNFGIEEVLEHIAPFYNNNTWIGSIQCAGGFFWTLHNKLGKIKRTFGFQRVPYICRTIEYGKSVHISGNKRALEVYYNHFEESDAFKDTLEYLFKIKINPFKHYLDVSISNSNPILHPSRLYSLFKEWNDNIYYEKEFYFYEEWNNLSSEILIKCDNELREIINKIPIDLSHIKSIKQHYDVRDAEELTKKLQSIPAFKGIKTSMIKNNNGYIPNVKNRYFTEDIPYGILLIKSVALITDTDVPTIDKIIFWAQKIMKLELLKDKNTLGKDSFKYPLPQSFEINHIDQLMS